MRARTQYTNCLFHFVIIIRHKKMGSITLLLSILAIFFVICNVDSAVASSRCPPPSAIYEYSKKEQCHSDSQCSGGKICCLTPARNKACVQPGFGASSSAGYNDKYKSTATGIYCGNTKCSPHEKCGKDSRGKPICQKY